MTDREAYIALNMMEQVGPVTVRALGERLGSVAAIFDAGEDALARARGVGQATCEAILRQRGSVDWRGELERAGERGLRLVTPVDAEYPQVLLTIHDPPLALYVKGRLESRDARSVAVVGTRRASHYGRETAERFGFQLAQAGFVVVSGLAVGIDAAAHRGALKARGRTLAVIGSGFDHLYPEANRELAEEVAASGAVLSELPIARRPDRTTFPMRNRIVSGMVKGVLVVEAAMNSGAMITANQAADQGRTVFAVPGRIDAAGSWGPHDLIKKGARLAASVDDIFEEFGDLFAGERRAQAGLGEGTAGLSAEERKILDALEPGEQDVDALIRSTGLGAAAVGSVLIGLEMKRRIRMLPGRIVEAVRR